MTQIQSIDVNQATYDAMNKVRTSAENMLATINDLNIQSREISLAITKLEECTMWANKALAVNQLNKG